MSVVQREVRYGVYWYHDDRHVTAFDRGLIERAARARMNAYAPYSNFWVGAAVYYSPGCAYIGCNVETCTYDGIHAERNCIGAMIASAGPKKIHTIAIIGAPELAKILLPPPPLPSQDEPQKATFPCESCQQLIWEHSHGDRGVRIVSYHPSGFVFATTIGDMMPFGFGPEDLGVDVADYCRKTGRTL